MIVICFVVDNQGCNYLDMELHDNFNDLFHHPIALGMCRSSMLLLYPIILIQFCNFTKQLINDKLLQLPKKIIIVRVTWSTLARVFIYL
jgi:hypothetical protein